MDRQAGFTLAELVIVMVLTGILAAVAVPRMFDMEQFSARGTRDFVGAALRYAQKSAIAMRRNVCVAVGSTQLAITYATAAGANQACSAAELPNPGNNLGYSDSSNALPARAPVATPVNLIFDAQGRPLSAPSVPRTTALTISVTGHATPLTIEPKPAPCAERGAGSPRQRGLSLVELVVAIMIISVSVAGVLMVFNNSVRNSADPMVRKQALAIAESLLNEVLAQPFTYCDPQDVANEAATPPASTAACTGGTAGSQDGGSLGPRPTGEGRFNATNPFDNVSDYHGYATSGVVYGMDDGANRIAALDGYSVSVSITRSGASFGLPADAALRVVVQVSGRGDTVTLTGYRFRYAPNSIG